MNHSLEVSLSQQKPISLDVRLSCQPGEMLALIGPSGSGKSTVLRTIAGLQKVRHAHVQCGGEIWLDSEANIELTPQRRKVGLVFQQYALFPHKSALENVMLAIQGKSKQERRSRALAWLERSNMNGLEDRRPHELSGGQRQRVALARALAREPAVLLLDEPFSAVDQQTRRKLYRELAKIRNNLSIPMLLVTHDINEVQQLADSLCVIHRGRTLQQGTVQTIINAPRSKEIAKLLGHQNLISARVSKHTADSTWYALEGNLASHETLVGPLSPLPLDKQVTLLIAPTCIEIQANSQTFSAVKPLSGIVSDAVGLGDELSVRLRLDNISKALRFRLPLHVAKAHGLCAGSRLYITIRQSGIHAIDTVHMDQR